MSVEQLPAYLTITEIDAQVERALAEDLGTGDVTSEWTIEPDTQGSARLIAKEAGVLAGTIVADRVFLVLDDLVKIKWLVADGDHVKPGQLLATLTGGLRSILEGERVMLNYLQRMSGIASHTAMFVAALAGSGTRVLDTRKTAPGLRFLDKWAVVLGGGVNHRIDLSDEVMIKENHITGAGGLREAILSVDRNNPPSAKKRVVVEISEIDQIDIAVNTGSVDRLLLDNMVSIQPDGAVDISMLKSAVSRVAERVETEASGNVTLETAKLIADTGVNFVSVGALTHSVRALDISLLVEPERHD